LITRPAGQDKLTCFFENAIDANTLGHAYIIEGDEGSGKKTLARYFAALSVCEKGNACGVCPQCKQTQSGANPDIITVTADGKSSIGVDKIRPLAETLSLRTTFGGRRAVIIENAELLTQQAQNALLKIIEEPPEGTVFMLLCTRSSLMLRTIISRTQVLKLAPLNKELLRQIAPGCTEFEYEYCGGNPGKLLKITENKDFRQFRDDAVDIIFRLFTGGDEALYDVADFFEKHKDSKIDLLTITAMVIRDVLYKKMSLTKFIINTDKPEIIDGICAVTTVLSAAKALEAILDSESGMGKYGNYNLAVQNMLIRCRRAIQIRNTGGN